jgi:alkanesulfonate monooxygenase SsuD/methylene tetrahydromethanopterin reductase-like flavin-dependent oxidoreductase (luciferase family)
MSGGRMLLGIGVGWLEEEFDAIGVPFAARGKRTDEYVGAMRELWSEGKANFQGEFVSFKDIYCNPRPVSGTVPIIVGGHTPAAAKRAGRLGDGFFPARGVTPELFDIVRRTAEENGRDPDSIEITATAPEDLADIPNLANMGVDRIMVPVGLMPNMVKGIESMDDMPKWRDIIDRYAEV